MLINFYLFYTLTFYLVPHITSSWLFISFKHVICCTLLDFTAPHRSVTIVHHTEVGNRVMVRVSDKLGLF